MFTKSLPALVILLWLVLPGISNAQVKSDSIRLYRIETTDGNEYTGIIVSGDSSQVIFKTDKLGTLTINKKDITQINPINPNKIKQGVYWSENPQSTRYLWAPNGYGLKKGEGYYQNIWVLFNQISVGVTDFFSIGAGTIPLFLFAGTATPVWITPKFSIPVKKDKFNLGAGALVATVLGEESTGFGLLYGIATAGSRDKNISLGLGYGYAGRSWGKSPAVTLSSLIRTSSRGYFITENYYINAGDEYLILLSAGYRWVIKKAGLDFGLVMPFATSMDTFIAFPWIGITIPFGNK